MLFGVRTAFLLGALACVLSAAPARREKASNATAPAPLIKLLREGRWRLSVGGVLCNACTRAVIEEFLKVEGVSKATFDFEDGFLSLIVARGAQVRTAALERAVRLASRRADLGSQFNLAEARYEGTNLGDGAPRKPDTLEDALLRPAAPTTLEPTP